ncbi:MAG: helix-turn-helix transcriptional regulator [Rhodobacter sp.]|nr:helix-turn-helix transcriptional regulator [Rhodobacter sp.]
MTGKPKGSHRVRWLWKWIAEERKRRGIGRAEFARRIGIGEEALRGMERGQDGSGAPALVDALAELGADAAVAEMEGMDSHAAALSLTERERERYDAIAERDGITRAQAIRQLAAEGLAARDRPDPQPEERREDRPDGQTVSGDDLTDR